MKRRTVVVLGLMILFIFLIGLPSIWRLRGLADKAGCLYRFKNLGQFAAIYHHPPAGMNLADVPQAVPPGAVFHSTLPPEQRVSWVHSALKFFDARSRPPLEQFDVINTTLPWDAPIHREVAALKIPLLLCPGALPTITPDGPAPTQFVGLSGIGSDSATLLRTDPRAGCFRYDDATPLQFIQQRDGLSNTLMFAETANELGPWLRGGPSTVRGLNTTDDAKPPLGLGGQFGGNYGNETGFGLADGSARFIRNAIDRKVFLSLLTIAGEGSDPPPGD
jgi:hypothetical protein